MRGGVKFSLPKLIFQCAEFCNEIIQQMLSIIKMQMMPTTEYKLKYYQSDYIFKYFQCTFSSDCWNAIDMRVLINGNDCGSTFHSICRTIREFTLFQKYSSHTYIWYCHKSSFFTRNCHIKAHRITSFHKFFSTRSFPLQSAIVLRISTFLHLLHFLLTY